MAKARLITDNLINDLKTNICCSEQTYILTSFIMKSGIELLQPYLDIAVNNNAEIKICVGDYLYITQPEALEILNCYNDKIETRLWRSKGVSFHPKAYLFENSKGSSMYVGSSNMSRSAYTTGIEWNLALSSDEQFEAIYEEASNKFMQLFLDAQTVPLNDETLKLYRSEYQKFHAENPSLVKNWTSSEAIQLTFTDQVIYNNATNDLYDAPDSTIINNNNINILPRYSQIPALESLQETIEEGYSKALVVMATGLGKTYLAAFLARKYERVLFIAHREEILKQAEVSFHNVMPDKQTTIFNGSNKNTENKQLIFASIYSLAKKQNLTKFQKDEFDLIIIDEFHHAAANTYQKVVEYFSPQFLLGITATPYRLDGKDIYAICDGNLAYQINFIEAISNGWLAPFQYYGIYDGIDYSQIKWLGTRYEENELLAFQLKKDIAEIVYKAWLEHKQTRTIVFCSSIRQANFLTHFFTNKGHKAVSLNSNSSSTSRASAKTKIEKLELELIFTVDLFNEGVDIPAIDTLLFVRPTESLTVFTQQLGRGLRKHLNKSHCVVIDLISNYKNADNKFTIFTEEDKKDAIIKIVKGSLELPEGCSINLDTTAIDIITELARKKYPRKEKIKLAYNDVKLELGRRPTYLEMHLKANIETVAIVQEFNSYIGFLAWSKELAEIELNTYIKHKIIIEEIEKTLMTKSYKMVLLHLMLIRGKSDWYKKVKASEIAKQFHEYYMATEYRRRIDFSDASSRGLWEYDVNKVASLISRMPMTKWSGTGKGLVEFDGESFSFKVDVDPVDEQFLYNWVHQVCEYRLHNYFQKKESIKV